MDGAQAYAGASAGRDYGNSRGSGEQAGLIEMPLDQLSQRLSEGQKRIEESTARVGALADRLLGAVGEKDPGGPRVNRPDRPGKVGSLNDQADALHNAISALEGQIMRLAPLAG